MSVGLAQLSGLTVLLAEDSPFNLKIAQFMLEGMGLKVEPAENGKIAVEKAQTTPFDIILMDCQMPEMDGFEATKAIRASEKQRALIIALTGNTADEDLARCREAGMDDVLAKPIDKTRFTEAVLRLRGPVA
jgi:CheY-like chemotaxis protein